MEAFLIINKSFCEGFEYIYNKLTLVKNAENWTLYVFNWMFKVNWWTNANISLHCFTAHTVKIASLLKRIFNDMIQTIVILPFLKGLNSSLNLKIKT